MVVPSGCFPRPRSGCGTVHVLIVAGASEPSCFGGLKSTFQIGAIVLRYADFFGRRITLEFGVL